MPYEKTESKLEDLLAKALNNEEIRDGANRADLKESVLRKRFLVPNLQAKAQKVWEAGAHDIEDYDKLENEYEDHVTQLRREVAHMRRPYLRIPKWVLVTILVSLSPIFLLTGLLERVAV
jgi:hypothetical protein